MTSQSPRNTLNKKEGQTRKIRKSLFFGSLGIVIAASIFIAFSFVDAQQVKTQDKPPWAGPDKDKDEEAQPLEISEHDIVTTESDALSVWRYPGDVPIWTTETESHYYNQVAVGDVDSDDEPEIVVPVSKGTRGKVSEFKIFIDVYNEGTGIPISSENYSLGYFSDPSRVICDIIIANVIPEEPGATIINEIVLQHWYNIVIFQWDGTNFPIVKRIEARYTGLPIHSYNGTTTQNFDDDPEEEIFVSGEDYSAGIGYIYAIDMSDMLEGGNYKLLEISSTQDCPVPGISIGHSLRVTDLDGDSYSEICLPGLVENRPADVSYWTAYLLVLDQNESGWEWYSTIIPGYETAKNVFPYIGLDVGELNIIEDGKEIALYVNQTQAGDFYLYNFKYPFDVTIPGISLQNSDRIYDVKIGNIDSGNKIVVCGTAPFKGKNRRKYFEVFYPALNSYWQVLGEKGSIGDLAIVN